MRLREGQNDFRLQKHLLEEIGRFFVCNVLSIDQLEKQAKRRPYPQPLLLRDGDTILVKGSRGMHLERTVELLQTL